MSNNDLIDLKFIDHKYIINIINNNICYYIIVNPLFYTITTYCSMFSNDKYLTPTVIQFFFFVQTYNL